jgi:hypothetical protein
MATDDALSGIRKSRTLELEEKYRRRIKINMDGKVGFRVITPESKIRK